jgi:hypothetical protein
LIRLVGEAAEGKVNEEVKSAGREDGQLRRRKANTVPKLTPEALDKKDPEEE